MSQAANRGKLLCNRQRSLLKIDRDSVRSCKVILYTQYRTEMFNLRGHFAVPVGGVAQHMAIQILEYFDRIGFTRRRGIGLFRVEV